MLAQDYNMTLDEALEKTKHRPDFQKKLQHSIDLLRKAEKLALKRVYMSRPKMKSQRKYTVGGLVV